ncbi:MAG: hypothetical protein ACOYVK_20840 [Bacillota bacterium]
MKHTKWLLLIAIFLVIGYYSLEATEADEISYEKTMADYDKVIKLMMGFQDSPTEKAVEEITLAHRTALEDFFGLLDQKNTLMKKGKLTEGQMKLILEKKETADQLDMAYYRQALTQVYKAEDFSQILQQAAMGESNNRGMLINKGGQTMDITLNDDSSMYLYSKLERPNNIFSRAFMIRTPEGNYYWNKPMGLYDLIVEQNRIKLTTTEGTYTIHGRIIP